MVYILNMTFHIFLPASARGPRTREAQGAGLARLPKGRYCLLPSP